MQRRTEEIASKLPTEGPGSGTDLEDLDELHVLVSHLNWHGTEFLKASFLRFVMLDVQGMEGEEKERKMTCWTRRHCWK
ncbi:unnamed protein product [Linum tenue]|uniref:Uncharacterized protein n=1 Tax=Linum tenue TaxID=586396 RepID=A0AAV0HCW2_9ROSI|nr:unnamed protein product [Linum tenue]